MNQYRILLVEDDDALRKLTAILITSSGHSVVTVASPLEAIKELRDNGNFDLMITDISMPEGSGIGLAVQAMTIDKNLRIIIMSGSYENGIPEHKFERPVVKLPKPFSLIHLTDAIKEAMSP